MVIVVSDKPIYEESFPVVGGNFDEAGKVSSQIKATLKNMGISNEVARRSALVAYESEINIVSYGTMGMIYLKVIPESVIIEAIDQGQGISDISLAMTEGYSTATDKIREMGFGAGMGLCNIKNYADHFSIASEPGKGTHLKMVISIPSGEGVK